MAKANFQFLGWIAVLSLGAGCSGVVNGTSDDTSAGEDQSPFGPNAPSLDDEDRGPNDSFSPEDGDDGPSNGPDSDVDPSNPADPSNPNTPSNPSDPLSPTPNDPSNPADPSNPNTPSNPSDPEEPVVCVDDAIQIGSAPMRRLSSREYLNTLEDLFPGVNPDLPTLPIEDPVDSFDNDARALGPSDLSVSRWEEIAFRYTSEVTASSSALEGFLPCAESVSGTESALSCGDELIDDLGLKTHRRPLTDEQRERYQGLFAEQLETIDFEAAVQLTAMAMLQSPWFLYRVEVSADGASDDVAPLDSWEMASRMSYFLWQSMPDQELFDAAASDALTTDDGIEEQARRMLADTRAREALGDFHRQWLYFDRILKEEHEFRVSELFPDWDVDVRDAAHEELTRFVEKVVFENDGTLSDLLLSRETEVNDLLAEIYGVPAPEGGQWESVTLPEEERAGLLTRVGFLAAHAHSANGSPPLRGSYIMQRILCLPPISPPPGVDTSPPETEGMAVTNREAFEERTAPSDCMGCHTIIDGFGFGFEHYDAVGAYRDMDNGKPVNAQVNMVGTDVNGQLDGAIEMMERFAESEQVATCAISRWYRYSRGRAIEGVDECAVNDLLTRFNETGGNINQLLVDIIVSPEFRHLPVE